ncbi:hypothetical protein GCM10009733_014220 [Nonomuraea maheshkhaliensis]|uniref:Uncharacterized protein n=1 Tax=Nonomuraea maheshkhaliensis TaxID=419590 RepID=A0ABN2EYM8_9ACTN
MRVDVGEEMHGSPVIAIWHRTVGWASRELAALDPNTVSHLKVRSGEHLAAILISSFMYRMPIEVDVDGGVDLLYSLADLEQDGFRELFPEGMDRAAFEIKSLGSGYRTMDSTIDRVSARGGNPAGLSISVEVKAAADILAEADVLLRRACDGLATKTDEASSQNAFLVIHPFDNFALETYEHQVIGPFLPDMRSYDGLDSIWVLWVPDHLSVWSKRLGGWTDLIFTAANPDEDHEPRLSVLQDAEAVFLEAIDYRKGSPYNFGFNA